MSSATGVGLLAALGAAGCYETSYALQALEARVSDRREALRATLLVRLAQRPRWVAGIALAVAGFGLQVLALAHAPLTLVQPVLALGLVWLLVLGVRVLDEHVGRRELGAVAAIVAGVVALALAAPKRSDALANGLALTLALVGLGLVTLAPFALRVRRAVGGPWLVASAGAADALAALAAKLVSDEANAGRPLVALLWAAGAGLAVLAGLTSETSALQFLPATRVAPVVLAAQVLIPTLLAPVVEGEDWGSTPLGGWVIVASLAAVGAGTAVLGASAAVARLAAAEGGEREHDGGGGGQLGERAVGRSGGGERPR
jgi:drug/metabolite transporter (DMT)-like permease